MYVVAFQNGSRESAAASLTGPWRKELEWDAKPEVKLCEVTEHGRITTESSHEKSGR